MGKYITLKNILKGTPGEGAHPICVIKKLKDAGLLRDVLRFGPERYREEIIRFAEECKREGKIHGIYKLFHT